MSSITRMDFDFSWRWLAKGCGGASCARNWLALIAMLAWMALAANAQRLGDSPVSPQYGQAPSGRNGQGSGAPTGMGGRSLDGINDELDKNLILRRDLARKVERKRRMVDAANRLVALTEQFQRDTAGHAALSDVDLKRLDDIAKLARAVKDLMRN